MKRKMSFKGLNSFASALIAIMVGLLAGFVILLISNPRNAFNGLGIILAGGLNNGMKGMGQVLYYAAPLIMTGLSVGFAFKTGLFNIGAPGQLMVGGFVSIIISVTCTGLGAFHWVFALLCGMLAGAAWGAIPGVFKALLNVNEVITSIMCNYIGMYGINYLTKNMTYINPNTGKKAYLIFDQMRNQTVNMPESAALPKWGLDQIFYNQTGNYLDASSVNAGIILAVIFAILIYILLNKTTFGYELKACGLNRDASRYAGINEKRSIILSMTIAGALAGAAGALMYLAPASGMHMHVEEVLAANGFNGIPVALLGLSNPLGIIFSALFIAHITVGGGYLQTLKYMKEIIDIITAMIIYFSAFSLFVKGLLGRIGRKNREAALASDNLPRLDSEPPKAAGLGEKEDKA